MLGRKCRRVAVLLRDRSGHGDHILLDAVAKELGAAGFTADRLVVRALPPDEETVQSAVQSLLSEGSTPVGLICRSLPLALAAHAAVASAGERRGHVALCDVYRQPGAEPPFPHIRSQMTPQQVGTEISRLLIESAQSGQAQSTYRTTPVVLCVPREGRKG
jgi:hypothetical protein